MAIHIVEEANRCLGCKKAFCQIKGCPVQTPIPQVIDLFKQRRLQEAGELLFQNNPMSAVCSMVCNHSGQCEGACIQGRKGAPVHFSSIENYISTAYLDRKEWRPAPSRGKQVAVVGSGPAGMTVAIKMAQLGCAVTVFEQRPEIGGVLEYGIPEFRLPKAIVAREVAALEEMGVKIVTDAVIGRAISIDELLTEEGFEAVFLGSGAGLPRFLGIPGENLLGVYSANEFLTRINLMKAYREDYDTPIKHHKCVAVVGAGNVAMDAARCAKRLGAEHVYVVYRRGMEEVPARKEEVHHAQEEEVEFKLLTNPVRVIGDEKGYVTGIECIKMELGEPDEKGRRRPMPVEGSNFVLEVDAMIDALGTSPNPLLRMTTPGLEADKHGCLIADEKGKTTHEGVFAGGDAVTGAATVILAMGAGKTAATAIDEYIKNKNA